MKFFLEFQTYSMLMFLLLLIFSTFLMGCAYSAILHRNNNGLKNRQSYGFQLDPSLEALENFIVDIYLLNVEDVCVWQTKIVYNPYILVVKEVEAGDFLSSNTVVVNSTRLFYSNESLESYINSTALSEYALLVFATDLEPGVLLIGGCRFDLLCISGSGRVATITFGLLSDAVDNIEIVLEGNLLLDIDLSETTKGSIAILS
ncbi:MAG: hypothetical protein QXH20_00970 [Candidatus Bathyarchaeia archaeon]